MLFRAFDRDLLLNLKKKQSINLVLALFSSYDITGKLIFLKIVMSSMFEYYNINNCWKKLAANSRRLYKNWNSHLVLYCCCFKSYASIETVAVHEHFFQQLVSLQSLTFLVKYKIFFFSSYFCIVSSILI